MRMISNKISKRWIISSIICFMALTLLAASSIFVGCAQPSQDAQKKSVNLIVKVPRTSHDVVFDTSVNTIDQVISKMAKSFEDDYQKHNVKIDVDVFEQNQYNDAIDNSFDTENAPDVLYGDYFNMSTYIYSGRVVPLDDVVNEKTRDDIYDHLWKRSTVDSRIYMLPYLSRQNVLAYNKDLFRRSGLQRYIDDGHIQSWTIEEWTEILDTLAKKLPDSVFPMMMYAGSSQGDTHIMTLLRSFGSDFFDDDGYFNLSTPKGIAALEWIQEGYKRGWYPPHCENLEIEDCSSLFREGQLAIYMINNVSRSKYGDSIGLVNFPNSDQGGCATSFVSGFEVFDNGDPEKVEVSKDFLRYIYDNEDLMSYAAGALPASKKTAARYGNDIISYDMFLNNEKNVVDFTGSNPDTLAIRDIFYKEIHSLLMGQITPRQAAERIDSKANRAIDEGRSSSRLHE